MSQDNDRQPVLDELQADLRQAEKAGIVHIITQRPGESVVWIGLANCRLQNGQIVYDSTAELAQSVAAGQVAAQVGQSPK